MASSGIENKYKDTATQVINMTGKYIGFVINQIESTSLEYINDNNIKKYVSSYKDESFDMIKNMQTIQNDLMVKTTVDDFILNIFIVADDDNSLTSKSGYIIESDTYQLFINTDTGKQVKGAKSKPMWFGSEALLDEKFSTKSTDYAMRLIQRFPDNKAFIAIDIRADKIKKILEETNLEETGLLAFVTKDGKEITASNKDEAVFIDQTFYMKAMEGNEARGSEYVNLKNETYLFMYSKIEGTDSMICALIPKATITSQADSIKQITILIVVIACVIAVFIGVFISTDIDKTITSIISGLKKVAEGDLTVDFHTHRHDEFKILIEAIQNTISNMKNLIGQVNLLSGVVSESSSRVNDTSASFLKSTEDISNAIREIEQGVMQQANDAEKCLMQMDNLSKKIETVSDNTKEIGHITDRAMQSITEGKYCTEELDQQTKSTIIITTDIVEAIENLAQKSKTIQQITNVINDIVTQTNLLSLNASIEAARAGEQGNGFSVVAMEIRDLAEKSKKSVHEIQTIINSIQKDTKNAVETAKKAESVLSLQEEAVKNTVNSYDNINQSVGELMVNLKLISENIESMEESRAGTLGAIENISAVLEEIAASSDTVNQNASEQIESVEALNKSAGTLSDKAKELALAIQKFTV